MTKFAVKIKRPEGADRYFKAWKPERMSILVSSVPSGAAWLDKPMASQMLARLADRLPPDFDLELMPSSAKKNPRRGRVHTAKWDRCVANVKAKGDAANPYAVCSASLGERASVRAAHRRKNPACLSAESWFKYSEALRPYGAFLTPECRIVSSDGKVLAPMLSEQGKRLVIRSPNGTLVFSGPKTAAALQDFVESYWFWTKRAPRRNPARNAARGAPHKDLKRAARLYKDFHGNAPHEVARVTHDTPNAAVDIGRVDAIEYTTTRDGKVEHYRHDFDPERAPDLAAGANGYPLLFIGGRTTFTDRGIEDK